MPKIAFFVPQFIAGGVQRTTLTLSSALAQRGWQIDLVFLERSEFLNEAPGSARLVQLKAPSLLRSLAPLARYLRNTRPDFLVASMPQVNIVSVVASALAGLSSTRLILTEVSHFSSWQHFFPSIKMSLIRLLMKITYPRADAVVCVTQAITDDLESFIKMGSVMLRVIPSPVSCASVAMRAAAPATFPWPRHELLEIISTLARLDRVKDIPTLIRAFDSVVHQRPTARLLIIGTGPERESLEGLVRDLGLAECVHFTGYVVDPYPLVARSRVFVLSSLIEGFPTAIVEALVLGVPVVSTDCLSGPREILDNGRFGRLVPIADSKALADAVLNTLLNGDIINTNDLRSRAEDFTEEHVVAEYAQLLGVLSRDK